MPPFDDAAQGAQGCIAHDYHPPTIVALGTLEQLTLGGTDLPEDGAGGGGDVGDMSF